MAGDGVLAPTALCITYEECFRGQMETGVIIKQQHACKGTHVNRMENV